MKRLLFACVMTMFVTCTLAQNNLYWTMRIKVKMDKKLEWEKKTPVFMKTHYPQFKYRVWEVMTGENSGSYVIAIGPMSYKDLDAPMSSPKGEALMKTDGQALDAISESTEVNHYRRVDAISTMKADRKLKYLQVTTAEITPGIWGDVQTIAAKIKEARDKGGSKMDIDFVRPSNSGLGNRFLSLRYFEKMEELDLDEKFGEMYDKVHGDNAFYKASQDYFNMVKGTWTELRVLRTDLSSL